MSGGDAEWRRRPTHELEAEKARLEALGAELRERASHCMPASPVFKVLGLSSNTGMKHLPSTSAISEVQGASEPSRRTMRIGFQQAPTISTYGGAQGPRSWPRSGLRGSGSPFAKRRWAALKSQLRSSKSEGSGSVRAGPGCVGPGLVEAWAPEDGGR